MFGISMISMVGFVMIEVVMILAMQLSLYLQLTFKHVLAASWQRSQDHEAVRDLIPALHLDGNI